MLTGENIVCFAKDWTEDPTSNNHVMRMLARDNKVLWLNSIATRTPKLSTAGDMGKIARKLQELRRGAAAGRRRAACDVYTPIVLPFPHSRAGDALNRQILRGTIGATAPPARHGRLPAVELHPDRGRSTSASSANRSSSTTAPTSGRSSATSTARKIVAMEKRAVPARGHRVHDVAHAARAQEGVQPRDAPRLARRRPRALRARRSTPATPIAAGARGLASGRSSASSA